MEVYLLLSNNKIIQNVISPIVVKISNKRWQNFLISFKFIQVMHDKL